MAKLQVLLEIAATEKQAFFSSMMSSSDGAVDAMDLFAFSESLLSDLPGRGVEVLDELGPVPMAVADQQLGRAFRTGSGQAFRTSSESDYGADPDARIYAGRSFDDPPPVPLPASLIVSCEVTSTVLAELESQPGLVVWPSSPITLTSGADRTTDGFHGLVDLARSAGGTDCRPYRSGATIADIRDLLGVEALWRDGFRGQNVVVGILDEGVNDFYPVVGGHETPTERRWGRGAVRSHGSMCAADILVAAPAARLYDYPFLGHPTSGGALAMFQAVLEQHRKDGTPHLTNNSYGFVAVPPRDRSPNHEIWNGNHPMHRKVREVVAEGIACFFAAGNCGAECPSGNCHSSGIGHGRSIHASNSLAEVVTVAAVNSRHERVGYSSQGPGMFEAAKPDIAAYTHFFGNFGPGRPGGLHQEFDNGTSAAAPVACGVGAVLLGAFPNLSPSDLKDALESSAFDLGKPGRDFLTGAGVVNAAAAYQMLLSGGRVAGADRPRLPPRA